MSENKIVGYKKIFGFVLPDWVDEAMIRMIVSFLLSVVVMFFVLIFVIWPKFSTVSELRTSLKEKQTQLDSLKVSKGGFDQLNEQIPETTQNVILQAIPLTYSPENAIFMLRNISSETGVTIVSYTLPPGVLLGLIKSGSANTGEVANFVSYPIRLSVTAPVNSLLAFISKIETSLPFGEVSDLGMQEVGKLSKSVSADKAVKMELEIRYYQTVIRQVDVSKIKTFTPEDISLVKKIEKFQKYSQAGSGTDVPVAANTGGYLFGF